MNDFFQNMQAWPNNSGGERFIKPIDKSYTHDLHETSNLIGLTKTEDESLVLTFLSDTSAELNAEMKTSVEFKLKFDSVKIKDYSPANLTDFQGNIRTDDFIYAFDKIKNKNYIEWHGLDNGGSEDPFICFWTDKMTYIENKI